MHQSECSYPLNTPLDLEDPDYRSIDAISQSGVRMFATEGPYTYYCRIVAKTHDNPVTKAMELGRAGHRFLECGCDVDKVFAVTPSAASDVSLVEKVNAEFDDKGSTAARIGVGEPLSTSKHTHKRYVELCVDRMNTENRVVVSPDKLQVFRDSVQSLYDSETCRNILTTGDAPHCEASIVRADEVSGVLFKCRADALKEDRIVDYKFTQHRKPSDWKAKARFDGSYYQALYYMDLFEREAFTWMLIPHKPPHEAFAITVRKENLESTKSSTAEYCQYLKRKKSVSQIAESTIADMVDCYVCDEWHHTQWYGESEVEDGNW